MFTDMLPWHSILSFWMWFNHSNFLYLFLLKIWNKDETGSMAWMMHSTSTKSAKLWYIKASVHILTTSPCLIKVQIEDQLYCSPSSSTATDLLHAPRFTVFWKNNLSLPYLPSGFLDSWETNSRWMLSGHMHMRLERFIWIYLVVCSPY